MYDGKYVKVAGWGRVSNKGNPARYLKHTEIKALSFEECKNTSLGSQIDERVICAYRENTDACHVKF